MAELRIPYTRLYETFKKILLQTGFSEERALLCAELFAKASLDGVASHGLNRFPGFVQLIVDGYIDIYAEPRLINNFGCFERWDGQLGPGNLNAYHCMQRAIDICRENGMGLVSLKNTNHWMRAGNFGWQAVDQDCIGICFTNTKPNMPAWGGSEPMVGNNPLVIAIPRKEGPVVLDIAMSQFSYGKMSAYLKENRPMPFEAGFDGEGDLTKDPAIILEKELALPIGLWKGAGLALSLDLLASVLADGNATHEIHRDPEHDISQVFMAIYPPLLGVSGLEEKANKIVGHFKSSATFAEKDVRYPGEQTLQTRKENLATGVPVDPEIWESVLQLLKRSVN